MKRLNSTWLSVQNNIFRLTLVVSAFSTFTTLVLALVFILSGTSIDYIGFMYRYYPAVGVDICVIFSLVHRGSKTAFFLPLFLTASWQRLTFPVTRLGLNELESFVYQTGSVLDLMTLVLLFQIGIITTFLWIRKLQVQPDQCLADSDRLTTISSSRPRTNDPSQGKKRDSVAGKNLFQGQFRATLSRIIGMLLLLSSLILVGQTAPSFFNDVGITGTFYVLLYSFGLLVIIPIILNVVAAIMVHRKQTEVSYFLPFLIIMLFGRAFLWAPVADGSPYEIFTAYTGQYLDRALIGLILLNTLLLPIDWFKGFRAKKAAQAV